MKNIIVSTTQLRKNLSEYLNLVRYQDNQIMVKKNSQIIAKVIPEKKISPPEKRKKKYGKWFGMWKKMPGSTIEIADRLRKEAWEGNYDNRHHRSS